MAFQSIDTGYKPEFGLGALYQGFNAANADDATQLDLIKNFLANQREQQLQPIDVAQAQQNLDAGKYKTSPQYQEGMTNTIFGQGKSNLAAGQTAEALQPFKQKAEQASLEQQSGLLRNLSRIQQIDDALNDTEATFQPGVREQLQNARTNLINRFKETPEFAQKRELKETGTDSAEYIAELRAEAARRLAAEKAAAPSKPLTMSQMEALYRDRLARDPNDSEAKQFLSEYERFKQTTQPGMGTVTLNPETKKLTTVGGNLGGQSAGSNDLQAAILAEIERRKQQGK